MSTSAALDCGQEFDLVDYAQARFFRRRDRSCRSRFGVSNHEHRHSSSDLAEDLSTRGLDDVSCFGARHAIQLPGERDAVSGQWTCRTRNFPRSGGVCDRDPKRATEVFDGVVRPTGGVDDRPNAVEAKDAIRPVPVACGFYHDRRNALPGTMHRDRPDSAWGSATFVIYCADVVAEIDGRWPDAVRGVHQPQDHYVLRGIGHWWSSFGGSNRSTARAVTPDHATGSRRQSGAIVAISSPSRSMAGHGPAPQVAARTGALRGVRIHLPVGLRPGRSRAGLSGSFPSAPSCPDLKPGSGPLGAAGHGTNPCAGRVPFPFLPAARRSRSRSPAARADRVPAVARRGEIARRAA